VPNLLAKGKIVSQVPVLKRLGRRLRRIAIESIPVYLALFAKEQRFPLRLSRPRRQHSPPLVFAGAASKLHD
jgi:hypothetical protein